MILLSNYLRDGTPDERRRIDPCFCCSASADTPNFDWVLRIFWKPLVPDRVCSHDGHTAWREDRFSHAAAETSK